MKLKSWYKRLHKSWEKVLQHTYIRNIFFAGVIAVIFFVACYQHIAAETYDIEKYSIAPETIRSPITVENTKETDRRIREVVQSVEEHYDVSHEIADERIGYIQEIFEAIEEIESGNMEESEAELNTIEEKTNYLNNIINQDLVLSIDNSTFRDLFEASTSERVLAKELLTTALNDLYHTGIKSDEVDSAKNTVIQRLSFSTLNDTFVEKLSPIVEFGVEANSFFSADKTNEAQKLARDNVEPVMIRAGEVIVEDGQLITTDIYDQLELTGLLNEEGNIFPLLGLALLVILMALIIILELQQNKHISISLLTVLVILSAVAVGMMKLVSLYVTPVNPVYFVTPIAVISMLITILTNRRLALVMAVLYGLVGSVIFNSNIPGLLNMEAGTFLIFSQFASTYFLSMIRDKSSVIHSGIWTAAVNIGTVCVFLLLSYEKYSWNDYLIFSGYGFLSAVLATVLTIGMLPFFETGLGILSDTRLLSLSSPNQPLLRKLLVEAPGTYHHSIMVANLSEAACESIGANGLLARVAAYYHDLGKTMRPHYFIENQMGKKNPHDYLDPYQSAEIILQHPSDSAKLLKQEKMPQEIIDVALQHHGTSLLKYFYYKAKEMHTLVKEEDFRYEGPRPKTKEAAIVSLCDSVEAAVRSLENPEQQKIEEIVSAIFYDRINDGQLNESSLTLSELDTVKSVICETLKGIYHSRIQYPSEDKKVKEA